MTILIKSNKCAVNILFQRASISDYQLFREYLSVKICIDFNIHCVILQNILKYKMNILEFIHKIVQYSLSNDSI